MGLDYRPRHFRCSICSSLFPSLEEAYHCCKRAKAQVLCSRLRENYRDRIEQHCNLIRASVLGRGRVRGKI